MSLSSRVCGREFCSKSKGIGHLSTSVANAEKLILKDMFSPSISTICSMTLSVQMYGSSSSSYLSPADFNCSSLTNNCAGFLTGGSISTSINQCSIAKRSHRTPSSCERRATRDASCRLLELYVSCACPVIAITVTITGAEGSSR